MHLVPGFIDIRPFKWLEYKININYTYTINLNQDLNAIWLSFKNTCRQNIRKGASLNCKLIKSNDASDLTELLKTRYNEQGINYLINPDYLNELLRTYPDNIGLYCLYHHDQLVGVTLNQEYKWFLGWMGLAKTRDKKFTYVNESMLWDFIQLAKMKGFSKFEISGANNLNLCQYRAKFNPNIEISMEIYKKDLVGRLAESIYLNFIKKY